MTFKLTVADLHTVIRYCDEVGMEDYKSLSLKDLKNILISKK